MPHIINFKEFKRSMSINEGVGSNVFKLDPDKPDSPDHLAKFTFTVKAQHPEGSSNATIGEIVTSNLNSQLQASAMFMGELQRTKGIPFIYARRNTTGGFLTGDRGVLVGSIVLMDPKKIDQNTLNSIPGFRAEGSQTDAMVGSQKIYDGDAYDSAKKSPTSASQYPPNYNPNAPVIVKPAGVSGTSASSANAGTTTDNGNSQNTQRLTQIKAEILQILNHIKETNADVLSMSEEDAKKLNDSISEMENTKPEEFCTNLDKMAKAKADLDNSKKKMTSVIASTVLSKEQKEKNAEDFKRLEELMAEITSVCAVSGGAVSTGQSGTSAKAEVNVQEVITGLMNLKFNTSSQQIRTLNGCLMILDLSLIPSLVEKEYKEKEDGTKIEDGLTISDTYNDSTAAAIAKVLGQKEPVKQITKEMAATLANKIIPITKNQFNDLLLKVRTGKVDPQVLNAVSGLSGTAGTSGTSGSSASAGATTETIHTVIQAAITGLAKSSRGPKVGVLQLAVSAISPDAKRIIDANRGVDKQYGGGTAKAVGQIIAGQPNVPINSISNEVAQQIANKVKTIEASALAKLTEDVNKMLGTQSNMPYDAKKYGSGANGSGDSGASAEKELKAVDTGTDDTGTKSTGDSGTAEETQASSAETAKNKSITPDSLSQKIVALFKKDKDGNNSSFWKEAAESEGNDFVEEDKAVELFTAWWNKNIEPYSSKFSKKVISFEFSKSVSFDYLKSAIANGLDILSSPTIDWTVDSSKKKYSVDTDLELNQYRPKQNIPQSKQSIDNSYSYSRIM